MCVTIRWKAVEQQYFTVVLFVIQFSQFVILENLSIVDLETSEVKGLTSGSKVSHEF